jgi:hypothetical protein
MKVAAMTRSSAQRRAAHYLEFNDAIFDPIDDAGEPPARGRTR